MLGGVSIRSYVVCNHPALGFTYRLTLEELSLLIIRPCCGQGAFRKKNVQS